MTEATQGSPSMLAHLIYPGKPVPAKLRTGKWGKIFNARAAYITAQRFRTKTLFRESPYDGIVRIEYFFGFPIPKSWPAAQRELAMRKGMPHTVKPDYDNLEKTYNDIIKGIVISDDCKLQEGCWRKEYVEVPRTEVWVYYG